MGVERWGCFVKRAPNGWQENVLKARVAGIPSLSGNTGMVREKCHFSERKQKVWGFAGPRRGIGGSRPEVCRDISS